MRITSSLTLCLLTVLGFVESADAQFTSRFRTNLRGDMFVLANSVVTCDPDEESTSTCDDIQSQTGLPEHTNDGTYNTWIDVDSDPSTYNSSSVTLAMPATSGVEWAGLYWYGNRDNGGATNVPPEDTRDEVLLATPARSNYFTITASTVDSSGSTRYMAFAEVSDIVRAGGNGEYTVANVMANTGNDDHIGGWMLLVITRDDDETLRHFSVFDGRDSYGGGSSLDVELNGFLTPLTGPVESEVLFVALDGDADTLLTSREDSVTFTPEGGTPTFLSNSLNPWSDFGNSTISYLGNHFPDRNPFYRNTLGLDVDVFDVSGLMTNDISSATATFTGVGGETNDAVTAAFKTTIYAPQMDVLKTVVDLNGGSIRAGDTLEYTVTVTNDAAALDNAVNVSLSDIMPDNATYVAESTQLLTTPSGGPAVGPLTDAAGDDIAEYSGGELRVNLGVGADASTAGQLDVGESTSLSFRVVVNAGVAGELVQNQARVTYEGETLADAGENYPAVSLSHPPSSAGPTTGAVTSDDDGVLDEVDPDDDNDGIPDSVESPGFVGDPGADQDSDGIPDWKDPDTVPGGCPDDGGSPARCTSLPVAIDLDGDGVPNHLDRDADGDGIPDTVESGGDADSDGDGYPDDLTDSDGDGVIDAYDVAPLDDSDATSNVTARDTGDGDGLPDYQDRDSDGDGLTDAYEAGYDDTDGDGLPDAHVDSDGDGLNDTLVSPRNTDEGVDDLPDYIDTDSDGDGLDDQIEAFDSDGNETLDGGEAAPLGNDADGDGIDDQYDPDCPGGSCAGGSTQVDATALTASQDADGDGVPDWLQGCGDAYVTGSEACDDANAVDDDGCSNACLIGAGGACTDSSDCAEGACHDDTATCEVCTDDATGGGTDTGCDVDEPVCTVSAGAGVCAVCEDDQAGTGTDDGCAGATPICDVAADACVACLDTQSGSSDLGCGGATPVCDGGACVGCEDDAAGTDLTDVDFGCDTDAPFCDGGSGDCLACLSDDHCDDGDACTVDSCASGACGATPAAIGTACGTGDVCDGNGSCEDCVNLASGQDDGCAPAVPFCDAPDGEAGTCVACLSNDDCGDGEYCTGAGACETGCDSNDDCATGACDVSTNTCATCLDSATGSSADAGCTDPEAPVCDGATGSNLPGTACVQCADDSQCGAGVCSAANLCVPCVDDASGTDTDSGCGGATPLCDTSRGAGECVGCSSSDQCGDGEFCNAAGSCAAGCDSDDDCADGVCDEATHSCAACINTAAGTDADEGCSDAEAPVCAGSTGLGSVGSTCVACEDDSQCTGVCDTGLNACVDCYDAGPGVDPGCAAVTPFCDVSLAGGVCLACLADADCGEGQFCDGTGTCQAGCNADDDCSSGVCEEATGTCVVCVDSASDAAADEGCDDPNLPVCAGASGAGTGGSACVECVDDGACDGGVCDTTAYACVTCLDEGDGVDPGCDDDFAHCEQSAESGRCVQCRDGADCGEGEFCDPSGACMQGCGTDDDCDGGVCDAAAQACVTCYASDAEVHPGCSADAPVCDETASGGQCVECLTVDDCSEGELCGNAGRCVMDPDLDSDDDGLPDGDECPNENDCRDTDGDGTPDYMDDDSDGDGIPDSTECSDADDCPDTDGDGVPDQLDDDDDGDQIPTRDEAGDADDDGTPDYLDPDTTLSGGYRGGAGCSAAGSSGGAPTWFALLALAGWLRRRRFA